MSKTSKFQEVITSCTLALRRSMSPPELARFDLQLNALPKVIKELNAEPYLFIFQLMISKKQLIESALASLTVMLSQSYIGYSLYQGVVQVVTPLVKDYSYPVLKLLQQIKEPHPAFLQLYFDIHSQIALPEDTHRKFKAQGYTWMVRAFGLTERFVPPYLMAIYSRFYPEELPRLPSPKQQAQHLQSYVGLLLKDLVGQVGDVLGEVDLKGKKGRCFICRRSADYYCKDTKVTICGVNCKKRHLDLLNTCPSLNFQYSQKFREELELLLIGNLQKGKSPALTIDFLVAVYLYSDYKPKTSFGHSKVLSLPVIFQRIWLLYLAYYTRKGESCQHILAACLSEKDFLRQMASEYFLRLVQDRRVLDIYFTFDGQGDFRLITFVVKQVEEEKRGELIQHLVKTCFQYFKSGKGEGVDGERLLVRSFNHEKHLTPQFLKTLFKVNYEARLVHLVFRNQTEINREKLSELLCSDEKLCRVFLQQVVKKWRRAPIDQLLREVFYFLNVKVADKIYRTLEILTEIYIPEPPFDNQTFFTYCYFILMLVTEINRGQKAQTLSQVLDRVQKFNAPLAREHASLIGDMLTRVSRTPFQQLSKGILSYYPPIPMIICSNPRPQDLILTNWETIYECAQGGRLSVQSLFQICNMVIHDIPVCQQFLGLLVNMLSLPNRDPFLLQAIQNILALQPNAACNLWRQLLNEVPAVENPLDSQRLSIGLMLQLSGRLTNDNFYQFSRQLCQKMGIGQRPQLFVQLLEHNMGRVGLVTQLLLVSYEKGQNYYHKVRMVQNLSVLLSQTQDQELATITLQMLRVIPVLPITQGLLLQTFLTLPLDNCPHSQQFWHIITHKCLEFKNDSRIIILEKVIKGSKHGEHYDSYLIQKTLNCPRRQLIGQEILKNLSKLEPYLGDISEDVLQLFVLEENLKIIASQFFYFAGIDRAYELLIGNPQIDQQQLDNIIAVVSDRLAKQNGQMMLLRQLPRFLAKTLVLTSNPQLRSSICSYADSLHWNQQPVPLQILLKTVNLSILVKELSAIIHDHILLSTTPQKREELFLWLEPLLTQLLKLTLLFQHDITLRTQLKADCSTIKSSLPSLLTPSTMLISSLVTLHGLMGQSIQGLNCILLKVQQALNRQAKLYEESKERTDSVSRMVLAEANKEALRYGELLVKEAAQYLKAEKQLGTEESRALRGALLELLLKGSFDESSGNFSALGSSPLAVNISSLFQLLQ